MKKTSYFYIIIFCIGAIISIIYYTCFVEFNNGNNREVPKNDGYVPLNTIESEIKENNEKYAAASEKSSKYVTDSAISGYMLKSDDIQVNLYEIYENGHKERIKTLDINPKLLRQIDRKELKIGIVKNTYEDICSLIEDFSS